jgi:protein-tyrosine phosphatase
MNTVGIYNWFDKIYTTNNTHLYLGAMPMKLSIMGLETRNDATLLLANNIHAVLSVVECYENRSNGILYSPILPEEFQFHNIKFLQIPIPDFCEVSIDKINTCVAYIYWNISNGRNVYISCRIGKCRSCLILMAYLIKYHGFTSENVYGYIQSIRPQVQNKHHKTLQLYEQSLV